MASAGRRDDVDLPAAAAASGRPSTGDATNLAELAVHRVDLAQHVHAVRAHRDVDRALVECARNLLDDFGQRLVVGDHADDDLAAAAGFGDRARDLRAVLLELGRLLARAVVDDEVVTAAQDARPSPDPFGRGR